MEVQLDLDMIKPNEISLSPASMKRACCGVLKIQAHSPECLGEVTEPTYAAKPNYAAKPYSENAEPSERYIVQTYTLDDGWVAYKSARGSRRGRYTLTVQESLAYVATLPEGSYYRVIKSTFKDGLINQEIVA